MTSELPFSDSFLVIQAKQAKSNQQAIAQYESQPFRIQKKNTRCFSFRHLMRAKVLQYTVITPIKRPLS